MGNGVSSDQGNLPTHDKRDVSQSVDKEQYDWSELAEAPETNSLLSIRKSYSGASNVGPSTSKDNTYRNRKSSVMKDDRSSSAEDVRNSGNYNGAQQRDKRSPRSHRKSPSPQQTKENSSSDEEEEEKRRSSRRREKTGNVMQVESRDFPVQNGELTQSCSIQTARTPTGSDMQVESLDLQSRSIQTACAPPSMAAQ